MTDTNTTEPPVTNEELYIALKKLSVLVNLVFAGILAASGYALEVVGYGTGGLVLLAGAIILLGAHVALKSRNGLTYVFEWVFSDTFETIEELDERLTDAARTDGRGGDGQ